MKTTWKFAVTLFACLGLLLGMTACDEALNGENDNQPVEEGCETDEDCEGDICVAGACVATCEDEGDCAMDEDCLERPDGGAEKTCQEIAYEECDEDSNCDEGYETCEEHPSDPEASDVCMPIPFGQDCTDHEDCRADEICQNEDVCIDPETLTYQTVLIEDMTDHPEFGTDRCDDTVYGYDTAGAKVFDIALYEEGSTDAIAYAEAIDFHVGYQGDEEDGEEAFFGNANDIFNGEAPEFEHLCPDPETFNRLDNPETEVISTFHEDAVLALGCGGKLFVQFKEDGQPRVLDFSHSIDVYVYGQACSAEMFEEHDEEVNVTQHPQSEDDPYDVSICQYGGAGPIDAEDVDELCDVRLNEDPIQGHGWAIPVEY